MSDAELKMLLFQISIQINGARRCFPETSCIAILQMKQMKVINALYER